MLNSTCGRVDDDDDDNKTMIMMMNWPLLTVVSWMSTIQRCTATTSVRTTWTSLLRWRTEARTDETRRRLSKTHTTWKIGFTATECDPNGCRFTAFLPTGLRRTVPVAQFCSVVKKMLTVIITSITVNVQLKHEDDEVQCPKFEYRRD